MASNENRDIYALEDLTESQAEVLLRLNGYGDLAEALKEEEVLNGLALSIMDMESLPQKFKSSSKSKLRVLTTIKWLEKIKKRGIQKNLIDENDGDDDGDLPKKWKELKKVLQLIYPEKKNFIKNMDPESFEILKFPSPGVELANLANIDSSKPENKGIVSSITTSIFRKAKSMTNLLISKVIDNRTYPIPEDHPDFNSDSGVRRIVVLGETGSGKSTLLNAMINFAMGIELKDPIRFKIVEDQGAHIGKQSVSQTSSINRYRIHNHGIGFALEVWDTPGFGDTGGIKRDDLIRDQVHQLLKNENTIHAICFVVRASDARLTATQGYIINSVLNFFGTEAIENMFLLVTFGDGGRPNVLGAIEESPFPYNEKRWYSFNNSVLLLEPKKRMGATPFFWDLGYSSLNTFFQDMKMVQPFSLNSTKEVIQERIKLRNSVRCIQEQTNIALMKRREIEENMDNLKKAEQQVKDSGLYIKKKITQKFQQIETNNITTYCVECESVCHDKCVLSNNADKQKCAAIDKNGNCTICVNKCSWDKHINHPFLFISNFIDEYETMKKTDNTTNNLEFYKKELAQLQSEEEEINDRLSDLFDQIINSLNRLEEIALLKTNFNLKAYLELLIEKEESQGNMTLAEEYKKLLKQEAVIQEIATNASGLSKEERLDKLKKTIQVKTQAN